MTPRRFPQPRQCIYWSDPERVWGSVKEDVELIEQYQDDSHLWEYLLKCRECGQLCFFQFYEEIDWKEGSDPQYIKYIPVSTAEEAAALARLAPFELLGISPALCIDYPKEANTPSVDWFGKQADAT